MSPADPGRPQAPALASRGLLVGILLLVLSMWTLSCLDSAHRASRVVRAASAVVVPLRAPDPVLALVLASQLRNKSRELIRGGSMFLATLPSRRSAVIPRPKPWPSIPSLLLVLSVGALILKDSPACRASWRRALRLSASS